MSASDMELLLRTIGVSTQYITTPESRELLKQVLGLSPADLQKMVQMAKLRTRDLPVGSAFDQYIQDEVICAGMATGTIRHWEFMKKLATDFCSGEPNKHGFSGRKIDDIQDFGIDDVTAYRIHLSKWVRPDTVRKALTALRRLLQWCDIHGYSVLNPGLIGLPKHEKRDIKFLTPEEVRDFIDVVKMPRLNLTEQARLRNVAICEVLFASGIRVSELIKLDRNSIKNKVFNVSGKSKYSRECYINDRAEKALNEYLATRVDNCTAMFISTQADVRMSDQSVRNIFKRACLDSDFVGVHPHTMRHSFATHLLSQGVDLMTIAMILGHDNVQTTQLYTHVTNRMAQRAYDAVMKHM